MKFKDFQRHDLFSRTYQVWKIKDKNSRTFKDLWEPWSSHHVWRQVAHPHGADSLVFKEMCCTAVVVDAATTDQSITATSSQPPWRSMWH